jgi:hypothetical protein
MAQTKVQLVSNIVGNVSGGASFTGIVTAAGGFSGTATTATAAATAYGLSGSPNIVIGNLTGVAATFTGSVSIGGTLTYEDVTNVDAVGLVTARVGVKVTAGGVDITAGGLNVTAGVSTLGSVRVSSGIVTAATGIVTYYGDGSYLTGVAAAGAGGASDITANLFF